MKGEMFLLSVLGTNNIIMYWSDRGEGAGGWRYLPNQATPIAWERAQLLYQQLSALSVRHVYIQNWVENPASIALQTLGTSSLIQQTREESVENYIHILQEFPLPVTSGGKRLKPEASEPPATSACEGFLCEAR